MLSQWWRFSGNRKNESGCGVRSGGVVFRWQPLVLLQELFPERVPNEKVAGEWAKAIFQTFDPQSDWALFDLGQIEPEPLAKRIALRTGLLEAELLHLILSIPKHLLPIQGTVDLLRDLKAKGHCLYFLSNMPAEYADHLVRENDFFALFEEGIFSAHVQQIKPEPNIFAIAKTRWPLRGAPIFLDDVQHNIDTASRLGWRTIRFENPHQARSALTGLGCLDVN